MKKNTRGEIATILTLSTLIIIGLSSFASSIFLKNKQTTKSMAASPACFYNGGTYNENESYCISIADSDLGKGQQWTCQSDGSWNTKMCQNGCEGNTCKEETTKEATTDLVTACKCVSGKPAGDCPVNPCGPIPETKSAPNDTPSCSNWGQWADRCSGTSEGCLSDAGGTYTYWCDGKDWRFQYANCVSWCQVDYLQKPPSKKDPLCEKLSAGDFVTGTFNGTLPGGVEKGDAKGVEVPEGFKYVSCDGNVGVWVDVQPFCDQFGQVKWGPGKTSKKSCTPPDINMTKSTTGKFYLTANVEVKKANKGIEFNTTVIFNSTDCDGDITLYKNGGLQAGPNRWPRPKNFSGGTFSYEYYPQWTGTTVLEPGAKDTASYMGRVDNCPRSNEPLQDTVSCEFGVSPYGAPWVRGAGCNLKNFDEVQKITLLTTPAAKQGKPVVWGPPPAPKISSPGIVYKFNPGAISNTGPDTCFMGNKGYKINDSSCENSMILGSGQGQKRTCQADGQWLYQMCTNGCDGSVCRGDPPPAAPASPGTPVQPGTLHIPPASQRSQCTHPISRNIISCIDWRSLNSETWENIMCNPSGKANDPCIVTCFDRNRTKNVECYPGDPNAPGNVFQAERKIFVINDTSKTIAVNKIYVRNKILWGETPAVSTLDVNQKLISRDQVTLFYKGLCLPIVGFGRSLTIDYSFEGNSQRQIINKSSGCTEDTTFIIKD